MTRILTATVLPDPPCDISVDFVLAYAGMDDLSWRERERLAREANADADADLLHDLEAAGLY